MNLIANAEFKVACVIPTYNGREELCRLLDSLRNQTVVFDVLIVDSGSNDGTLELAEARLGKINVHKINSKEFNHGATRQLMIDLYSSYSIYVFLTQDAYLEDASSIQNLIEAFRNKAVGAVCGRQLPHHNATPLAQHARAFNYPADTLVKSLKDASSLGIKTIFMSNSFAAYRRIAMLDVGGFPNDVILGEDMYVAGRMLLNNWKVVYAGTAECRHSHNYSLYEEFSRYFDIGVFHSREPWLERSFSGTGGEGYRYVISEFNFLSSNYFYLLPHSVIRNFLKLLGYKIGRLEKYLPNFVKLWLSMHKRYWK